MKKAGWLCLWLACAGGGDGLWAKDAASSIAAGNQAYQAKDYAQAERDYQAASKLNPRLAQAYEGIGNCEYMLGHLKKALEYFQESVQLDPSNTRLKNYVRTLQARLSGAAPSGSQVASPEEVRQIDAEADQLDKEISDAEPFKPYWENEIEASVSNQQEGQSTGTLTYMGTYHADKAGDTFGGEAQGIHQKVEGSASNIGALAVDGGLGIDSFTPSLNVGVQDGQSQWRQLNGTLTLTEQFWDPLAVSYMLGGNIGSHYGGFSPVFSSAFSQQGLPPATINALVTHNYPIRIDTDSWNTSIGPVFTPWDWWSISPTAGYEYDNTFQIQVITPARTFTDSLAKQNEVIGTVTLTLTMDFTLFKGFILEIAPQVGWEYYPAGVVYSPNAGGVVYNATATTVNFTGGTTSISYSFE